VNSDSISLRETVFHERSTTYPRGDIKEISQAMSTMSTMPPMIAILNKSEIRDLVAYLASLKAPK